ncbi:hypothetical protein PP499_gp61 [Gordonia phage Bjanes7]|uniref:Uncharacterized protein n=5 Tax=Caudoviricetes TaxID=2731619 RepID=A0A2H4PEU9_9CAUD|nr:hypothetical protein PP487_gp70 [Gordonia phage Herod]YP_010653850.1 hypothetical protein PP499_gp61 [Gordonia phage Bjanes7]AZS12805.1 hypothetical protein SEA_SPROUTIE_64 [Gordonia phage Sproutie]AZS12878.1 hypothetical protein SEA_SAVAGE_64 [Gordonia phage Savage]QGJ96686.1 hypothetical protein SEA_CYNTHIA_64 [Gordonia phage Cynthia]QPL13629.1 hypothetical protein SEA_MOCHA12_64 [Gordonia phage Mocha12]ATW60755.1 hypothetical protein SEA_BJANES7_61 [Gordonia phage Bjanes7]
MMADCFVVDFAHRRDGGPPLIGPFDDQIEAREAGRSAKVGRFDIRTVYPPDATDITPAVDPWASSDGGDT